MTDLLATLFVTPIALGCIWRLLLMLPLCLSISIVYKTTRCERLEDLPGAVVSLWITIVLGMFCVGVGFWIIYFLIV